MASVYETITDRIISSLEAGRIPWRKEWNTSGKSAGLPYNLVSGKPYRGANVFSLICSGYASTGWATYKQAQGLGYQVRKGEKASPVMFWKFPDKARKAEAELKGETAAPFARLYFVFNVEQLDGVPVVEPAPADPAFNPLVEAEAIIDGFMASASHPRLEHGGDAASFSASKDLVRMPARESFLSAGGYYATLFHEFAHSTGVESRLDRPEFRVKNVFGDEAYSREELTAEFAAAFLCAEAGISNEERIANSIGYIQGWISALKNDKTLAVQAAQRAQRAADFILGRSFADASESEASA